MCCSVVAWSRASVDNICEAWREFSCCSRVLVMFWWEEAPDGSEATRLFNADSDSCRADTAWRARWVAMSTLEEDSDLWTAGLEDIGAEEEEWWMDDWAPAWVVLLAAVGARADEEGAACLSALLAGL